jgi:hypothetical protein
VIALIARAISAMPDTMTDIAHFFPDLQWCRQFKILLEKQFTWPSISTRFTMVPPHFTRIGMDAE